MALPEVHHPTKQANFCYVAVGGVDYWFSYRTCIAFHVMGQPVVMRENEWGPTTGKHMAYIGIPKKDRVSREAFAKALADL